MASCISENTPTPLEIYGKSLPDVADAAGHHQACKLMKEYCRDPYLKALNPKPHRKRVFLIQGLHGPKP